MGNEVKEISEEKLDEILAQLWRDDDQRILDVKVLHALCPLSSRMVVTKPEVSAYHSARVLDSGVRIPDFVVSSLKEFGMRATVLKVGPNVYEQINPGDEVVIPEFAGKPVYLGFETPYFVIGEGDVLLHLIPDGDAELTF